MLRFSAAALCLLLATPLAANPGAPIPLPSVSLEQAVQRAGQAFATEARGESGFFVQAVEYTDRLPGGAAADGWAWLVTFRHPVRNDRSFVFRVAGGRAELVATTE